MSTNATRTAPELGYNGHTAVLLRYPNGERALWVTDEYLAGKSDTPRWTLNDINTSVDVTPDDDINAIIASWESAVEWDAD